MTITFRKLAKPPVNRHCKIGKVTYKTGQLVTFPRKEQPPVNQQVIDAARMTLNELKVLDGYVLLAWQPGSDGLIKVFYNPGQGRTTLDMPNYAAEIIRWSFGK